MQTRGDLHGGDPHGGADDDRYRKIIDQVGRAGLRVPPKRAVTAVLETLGDPGEPGDPGDAGRPWRRWETWRRRETLAHGGPAEPTSPQSRRHIWWCRSPIASLMSFGELNSSRGSDFSVSITFWSAPD